VLWDRRRAPRETAAERRLWLGWRTDEDFVVVGAELMNISHGGALVVAEAHPPRGETIWLRLEGPAPIDDVCALVLETTRIGRGQHGMRIAFREPFPNAFYQAAVAGLEAMQTRGK
jgi:hypothetical protein